MALVEKGIKPLPRYNGNHYMDSVYPLHSVPAMKIVKSLVSVELECPLTMQHDDNRCNRPSAVYKSIAV